MPVYVPGVTGLCAFTSLGGNLVPWQVQEGQNKLEVSQYPPNKGRWICSDSPLNGPAFPVR
jgi:hypothetical protein